MARLAPIKIKKWPVTKPPQERGEGANDQSLSQKTVAVNRKPSEWRTQKGISGVSGGTAALLFLHCYAAL